MKRLLLLVLFCCLGAANAAAQTVADADDYQSWNDVQATVPVNEKFDLFFSGTLRFGSNVSRLNDARLAAGVVYKPSRAWSLSPFYWHIRARNSRGVFQTEHRLNLRVNYRFPFKKFGLSHRSGFEYRIRPGQNSWRYRPSVTVEKELPKKLVSGARVFVTEEVFYDSILKKFSRNRFTVGVGKTLTKKLALDVFYMRQSDNNSRPGNLNVIGTTWRLRF